MMLVSNGYLARKFYCFQSPSIMPLTHSAIFPATCNAKYSTLGRCKIGKLMFQSQFGNMFLAYQTFVTNLHLLRVELRCK